ncbi:response regulator [Egibacter rhizosphaerae]|uniref:Response regulator n=1 Tax=Egibacter rhizosphaerae TaxID=1670831 RepID=A0A411YG61_9ACTN|nr:FAD-dependent oxidoreductase [Egibacter rhizosphaerae]QBI20072.1 response regulator [Egibacter rhizosphaerae]
MTAPVILAVDDDPTVRSAVEADLRDHYAEHYRVVGASSGDEALHALRRLRARDDPVALLLADQRMPGMTGVELLQHAVELYPDAKRALLTAYADTEAAIAAINDAGVDHYLLKPWHPPEERLYPVLDDLLETWRPPPLVADLRVIGHRWSPASHAVRQLLARNLVPYRWLDLEREPEATTLLELVGEDTAGLPVVVLGDGNAMSRPGLPELAQAVGLKVQAERATYDLVVIGAGPAGLAAGVYGASEGLSTLVVDQISAGGQAGTSSRIENYLGFPAGLSGADLTMRAHQQASRFGAEILTPVCAVRIDRVDPYRIVRLDDGSEVTASGVVVATGVSYRTLQVPGVEGLTGAGVYYAAGRSEALDHEGGEMFVIGGGNSAGQGAMFLTNHAAHVTLLVREPSLAGTMSRYLQEQLESADNLSIRYGTVVTEVKGSDHLEALVLAGGDGTTETVPADALFVFIGMAPRTDWVQPVVATDPAGFLLTGLEVGVRPQGWNVARQPLQLETSAPGVFAAGDVRAGSIKRVASAVGEGAMAVRFVHEHLANL